jgi:carbon storage regulator
MLVLGRKRQESVVIGAADNLHALLRVTVLEIRGSMVKLGFEAEDDVAVHREEVWERLLAESQAALPTPVIERPKNRVPYLD